VHNVRILEDAHHVEDAVDVANVREESIAEARALMRSWY
jgi:hypothetical protein